MSGKRKSKADRQIDLTAAIEAPVKVKRDGETKSLHPHEAVLKQHVRKAVVDGSVPSMKFLIGEAEKHKVIKPPPSPPQGGVFVVPKGLPEEVARSIFDYRPEDGTKEPLWRIVCIILNFFHSIRTTGDGE